MFDFVRKHNKLMQIMLFVLIVPSFVMFGIEGYTKMSNKGEEVARVAGEVITSDQLDQVHRSESDRIKADNAKMDPKLLDSPEARQATLDKMLRERVLLNAVSKSHLSVSDQRLADELQRDDLVKSLKGPDGKLDMSKYHQMLAQNGLKADQYENRLRTDLATRQILGAIYASGITGNMAPDTAISTYFQNRTIALARFDSSRYMAKLDISEDELKSYHQRHGSEFKQPEKAQVEYITLDLESVKKSIQVQEADLRSYYEQNMSRMAGVQEVRASHILIAAAASAPPAEREKAKAKAQQLHAQVKQAPQTFAGVARKESQDPGSASQGGDLGFFGHGAMTKAFEDAAFALKKGEVSAVVETEFGYHIILVSDVKQPKVRTFEDMRKELDAEVRKQLAQKKYAEMAEAFSNGVYEQSDSLKPVADKLKLEIQTATLNGREPAVNATGALANARFVASLFQSDAIQKKRNIEAVEVAPNTLASGRVTQYTPDQIPALENIKSQVRQAALQAKAAEMARKDGEAALQKLSADAASISFAAPLTVSRQNRQGLESAILNAALRANASKLPAHVGVDLGQQGYVLVKITQVQNQDLTADPAAATRARQQYAQWWASAETSAYYQALKERFKVAVKASKASTADGAAASGAKAQ